MDERRAAVIFKAFCDENRMVEFGDGYAFEFRIKAIEVIIIIIIREIISICIFFLFFLNAIPILNTYFPIIKLYNFLILLTSKLFVCFSKKRKPKMIFFLFKK